MKRKITMKTPKNVFYGVCALLLIFIPGLALAQDQLNTGDTAWMMTSTALVLFMTIPGLSLFYAGMVRAKSVPERANDSDFNRVPSALDRSSHVALPRSNTDLPGLLAVDMNPRHRPVPGR